MQSRQLVGAKKEGKQRKEIRVAPDKKSRVYGKQGRRLLKAVDSWLSQDVAPVSAGRRTRGSKQTGCCQVQLQLSARCWGYRCRHADGWRPLVPDWLGLSAPSQSHVPSILPRSCRRFVRFKGRPPRRVALCDIGISALRAAHLMYTYR